MRSSNDLLRLWKKPSETDVEGIRTQSIRYSEPGNMNLSLSKPAVPSTDKRWKIVDATMRRVGQNSRGLIETLHTVQEAFGYLDETSLEYVAASLRVPLSRAYGVATFYHFFTLKPAGDHTCVICLGTACYIKGAPQLLDTVRREFGVSPGETTRGGKVSIVSARCLGSCGLAPAVVYDNEVAGKVTPDQLRQHLSKWGAHDA
jgi:bidirectional [NiFe] hydrogenase diaphorase subunit